jgi:hypothetical protein
MQNRDRQPTRRCLATALATGVLALLLVGLAPGGAGAASAAQPCPDASAGQAQRGTANTAVVTGQTRPADGQAVEQGQVCAGGATGGVSPAPEGMTICTIVLPEGAAPGTLIVVGQALAGPAGEPAVSCTVQTDGQAAPGTGGVTGGETAGSGSAGGCVSALPGNATSTADAPTGANQGAVPPDQTVVTDPAQGGDATGQEPACVKTVPGGAQGGAGDAPAPCTIVNPDGTTATDVPPVTVVVSGQVLTCVGAASGGAGG